MTTFFFSFFFFSPQLILQTSNGQFQGNLSFFKVPEGVQHFPGRGVQLIPGGGVQLLIPYTHITCDFPGGGPDPLSPPLDPHLSVYKKLTSCVFSLSTKYVTYWYQFCTCCEELVPILHSVKFTKCEICGSTVLTG